MFVYSGQQIDKKRKRSSSSSPGSGPFSPALSSSRRGFLSPRPHKGLRDDAHKDSLLRHHRSRKPTGKEGAIGGAQSAEKLPTVPFGDTCHLDVICLSDGSLTDPTRRRSDSREIG